MTETNEAIKIHRCLTGVYFDRSPCTFIDGKAGELRYRGYSIHDLAEHSSFEKTAWLLLNGELPTKQQLAGFDAELKAAHKLPAPVLDIIRSTKDGHPMDVRMRPRQERVGVADQHREYIAVRRQSARGILKSRQNPPTGIFLWRQT
jgi:citrate synthase